MKSHDYTVSTKQSKTKKKDTNFEEHEKVYFLKEKRHSLSNIFLVAPWVFWGGQKWTLFAFQMPLDKGWGERMDEQTQAF